MRGRVALFAALAFAAGCRDRGARAVAESATPAKTSQPTDSPEQATHAVQVASFASSASASTLRDSLSAAGWSSFVSAADVRGEQRWRVLVAPSADAELAELIAAGLRAQGRQAVVSRDAPPDSVHSIGVHVVQVNYGTYGMASTLRWAQPDDRHALLVTVDPTSVEADPLPNGFAFADEARDGWLQVDRVWDVAPSPDWTRIAYGKAYVLQDGEREVPPERWAQLAQRLGSDIPAKLFPDEPSATRVARLARELQAHKFPASGMAIASGVGITFVVSVAAIRSSDDVATRAAGNATIGDVMALDGWRVRWTSAGDTLGVGTAPNGSQDFAPARRWILIAPGTGARATPVGETADSARFIRVPWRKSATLDISLPIDLAAPDSIPGGEIRSSGGWIRVQRAGERVSRVIGPGRVLAATARGRYIAALAPRPGAASYETPVIAVVYQVR